MIPVIEEGALLEPAFIKTVDECRQLGNEQPSSKVNSSTRLQA